MKVVINVCHGGFDLSEEAFELYLKKKGIKFYKYPSMFQRIGCNPNYCSVSKEQYDELKGNRAGLWLHVGNIKRDDPVLIEVVEELKEKANGFLSELKVIEIPDGVEWEIKDIYGVEYVAEKHRTWS